MLIPSGGSIFFIRSRTHVLFSFSFCCWRGLICTRICITQYTIWLLFLDYSIFSSLEHSFFSDTNQTSSQPVWSLTCESVCFPYRWGEIEISCIFPLEFMHSLCECRMQNVCCQPLPAMQACQDKKDKKRKEKKNKNNNETPQNIPSIPINV